MTNSLEWAETFLVTNGRLPHAVDYAQAGFTGGQCSCERMADCPLRESGKMHEQTNRNCYADQLRDFISLVNKKVAR